MGTITITVVSCATGVTEVISPSMQTNVYPNPFSQSADVVLMGAEALGLYQIRIFDLPGNIVRSADFIGDHFTLERGDLSEGIYFYKVVSGGRDIHTGKFIIRKK